MKMKRALIKFNPGDSHVSENLKSPDLDDRRMRLERRWRRREVMVDSLKHRRVASATNKALKICGSADVLVDKNDHMRDDETDEECKTFLATYSSDNDDDDEMDEDYRSFLATYNSDSNHSGGSNIGNDETYAEYISFLATYDPDVENDSAGNQSGGSNIGDDETDAEYMSFLATYDPDVENTYDPDVENASAGNLSGGSNIGHDETDAEYMSFLATYDPDVENDSAGNLSGGSNIGDDETDAEYMSFLATYDPDVENDSPGNLSGGSNIGDDETDAEYMSFLATYDPDVENDSPGKLSGGSNIGDDETDAEYMSFLATYDPDVENDSAGNHSGGSNVDVNFGNNNVSEEIKEGYNCFLNQFVFDYIRDGDGVDVDEDDRLRRKSLSVGKNSLVSDKEFDTPEVQCVVDKDYERFLNSGWVVDGDFVYGCDKNTKNKSNVEDESNSSDSDLIVLESFPNCENTPFVSSKEYDSSCFVDEMHPADNMQMTSFYHSQFRKRLVEYLDRPYDYEEYKSFLAKANERRQKERHLETRQGVIKSYQSVGVSKSYLDLYPDLAKAIAMESKENRILFLLRGLFFWLQNSEGKFQPWLDKSCLEMMQRL